MTPRIAKLRQESFEAQPDISVERAVLVTQFYKENYGKYSIPVFRALNFKNLCQKKTIYIGNDELIVGERGPYPKAVSTFWKSLTKYIFSSPRPMLRSVTKRPIGF